MRSGGDQHAHSSAANAMVHFWLANLGVLPTAVLRWGDVGERGIRESRETCWKGTLWRRQNETRSSLCTEKTDTVRETEGGNSSLFFQCDSNSEEQVCRDILTDMPHPPLPSLQSPLLSGSPSPSSCKKALGPHAALSPSESRQHQFLPVSTVVTALAHYQLTQRV